jgi:RNA polymerase sigma-70 factor (ECF subfamily)
MICEERRAGDLVQESFLKAYRTLATFRGGSFKCWLLRIVSNLSIDYLHNRQCFVRQRLDKWTAHKAFRHLSVNASVNRQVRVNPMVPSAVLEQAINTIPPDLRIVLLLRDIHGQSYEEVAAITGAPLGTVAAQINRARAKVYAYLVAAEPL